MKFQNLITFQLTTTKTISNHQKQLTSNSFIYRSQYNHTIKHVNFSISYREDTHPISNQKELHIHESITPSHTCIPKAQFPNHTH